MLKYPNELVVSLNKTTEVIRAVLITHFQKEMKLMGGLLGYTTQQINDDYADEQS